MNAFPIFLSYQKATVPYQRFSSIVGRECECVGEESNLQETKMDRL